MEVKKRLKGVIPAFYACYDDNGNISEERTNTLARHLLEKGVDGVYVGGSSGECIYHSLEERKLVLSYVAKALKGKVALIAHVGAPSTKDSIELAKHAEVCGYDALSAIPPIYFKLPDTAVSTYWTDIMNATDLPFIIYNIPQTTGYTLTTSMFSSMLRNDKVIGVKNSSMLVVDIEQFKAAGGGGNVVVFNGPDEQYVAGRIMGADGGIGGTYAVMPELFLQAEHLVKSGNFEEARSIQAAINHIIFKLCSLNASMYAVIKEILKKQGVEVGGVRAPLEEVPAEQMPIIDALHALIRSEIERYCHFRAV